MTLSLMLHVFAVFPLLAEQFSASPAVLAPQVERSLLSVPKVVFKPAPTTLPTASAQQSAVAPKLASVMKTQPEAKAKPMVQSALVKPVPKPQVKSARSAVGQRSPVVEKPQAVQAVASVAKAESAQSKQTPTQSHGAQTAERVTEVISKEPRFAQAPAAPVYPAQARRRQQHGTVWVDVRLDARGQQMQLQVLRSSGVKSLDQSALAAVKQWQFLPELDNGIAVPSRVHIPIEFAIAAKP